MRRSLALTCLLLLFTSLSRAQSLHYRFAAPNAVHHEATITLTVKDLPKGPALFRMSRSSPGRYATHEFGKNVYQVSATDANGKVLPVQRMEADVYEVSGHAGTVVWQYTLFANYADGTYAAIDADGFHLNMPAAFMWVKGLEKAPITLMFDLPQQDWSIASQLFPTNDAHSFTAPDLQYFLDAPVKAGKLRYREWMVNNKDGKAQTIRIAYDTKASDAQLDAMSEKVKRIVAESGAVFGEYPAYETGRYTFLASLNPYVQSDGMEHRNSTMITMPVTPENIESALSTFSHEYFHCWNVERIRPKTIEPFNFEKSNVSDGLWVAEGFTQYYGSLIDLRSNIADEREWLGLLGFVINTKLNRPGGKWYNVIANSQHAVFADAGAAIDKNNFDNIFSSYYVTGAAMALALELELRTQFGKTLDNYMQTLWQKHGKPGIPYTMPDLEKALALTTGDAKHAASFFAQYVYGNQPYDYAGALKAFGINTRRNGAGKAWAGNTRMEEKNGRLTLAANTTKGTPLYDAGIDINDEIISMDGQPMGTRASYNALLAAHKPGEKLNVVFTHHGAEKQTTLVLSESPDLVLEVDANAGSKAENMRRQWWSSRL